MKLYSNYKRGKISPFKEKCCDCGIYGHVLVFVGKLEMYEPFFMCGDCAVNELVKQANQTDLEGLIFERYGTYKPASIADYWLVGCPRDCDFGYPCECLDEKLPTLEPGITQNER